MPLTAEEQAAADKAVADKTASDKAAADKAAADKAAAGGGDDEKVSKKYAEDLRRENQKFREGFEDAQKKLAELSKFKEDTENAKLKDEKKFEELADKERKAREKVERESADKVTAMERRAIKAEVKSLAVTAGLVDPDDVDLIDLSGVKIEDDKIVGADKVVEAFKKAKPHKFTDPKNPRGGLGTGDNPNPGGNKGDVDYRKMSPAEQAETDRRLRAGKV